MSDLIDRPKAIKAIKDLPDCYNGFSDCYDKACIIGVLEEIPTIEAEPVKSGRWEYKHFSSEPHCSFCLAEYPIETNYCPNCGAKMDGGAR